MANGDTSDLAPAAPREGRVWVILRSTGLALVLVLYAIFLLMSFAPAISAPDANGYWAQGSLMVTTGRTWFTPESDSQYIGMHWLIAPSEKYYSRYPPGLPVLIGLVYKVLGYKASVFINPALALLSLLGFYLVLRRFVAGGWALAGLVMLAANPTFTRHALACDAHMAVLFCLVWGVCLLLRWSANGRLWEALTAGFFLGAIPAIRYPEALFGLGIGVFLLGQWRSRPRIWLHYLAALVGAAIPLVPLLIRNHLAFGAFWRTAYALTNEQTGFGWEYFSQHALSYIRQINGDGLGPVFILGAIGMTAMCAARGRRATGLMLVLITVPTLLLYMAYYWMGGAGSMRFLLPTFPCYILAGMWALSEGTARAGVLRPAVLIIVLLLQALWGVPNCLSEGRTLRYQNLALARITDVVEANTQPGDVVMAHQQILQNLDFVRRWRLAELPTGGPAFDRFRRREQDPDAPSPMQEEKRRLREEKYKGLSAEDRERKIAEDIRRWAAGGKVYLVSTERDMERMRGPVFGSRSFRVVARVSLPDPPPTPRRDGFMGGGRFRPDGDRPPAPPGPGPDAGPPPPPGAGPRDGGFGFPFGGRQRGGMGGPFGMGFLAGEKEVVLAEWTLPSSGEKK